MIQDLHLSPRAQAHCYALGLLVALTLGTLAMIGLVVAAFWLLIQFCALLLSSTLEACSAIGGTFASADPLVKFLILASVAYIVYRVVRRVWRH